jgi:hypothetical protein
MPILCSSGARLRPPHARFRTRRRRREYEGKGREGTTKQGLAENVSAN